MYYLKKLVYKIFDKRMKLGGRKQCLAGKDFKLVVKGPCLEKKILHHFNFGKSLSF